MMRRGLGFIALLVLFLSFASLGRLAAVDCDDKCREIKCFQGWDKNGNKVCAVFDVDECTPCIQVGYGNCRDDAKPGKGTCNNYTPFGQTLRDAKGCVDDICTLKDITQTSAQAKDCKAEGMGLVITLTTCKTN